MPNQKIITEVRSEGTLLASQYHLQSITVKNEVNQISSAHLVLVGKNPSEGLFAASDDDPFRPGRSISIAVGNGTSEMHALFSGIVVQVGIRMGQGGEITFLVEGNSPAFKMNATRNSQLFAEVTDAEVMEELLSSYGIPAEIESTQVRHAHLPQNDCTDWDFMLNRLDVNNKICLTEGEKIRILEPVLAETPALQLAYGQTLLAMELETDARLQYIGVDMHYWKQTDLSKRSESVISPVLKTAGHLGSKELAESLGTYFYNLNNNGPSSDQEMKAWGDSFWRKRQLAKIRGTITFEGVPGIRTGDTIELAGVGSAFNGAYFVSGLCHQLEEGQWKITAQLGLNPHWFERQEGMSSKPASGLLPQMNGLQMGIVKQLATDPEGEHRIKIAIPSLNTWNNELWVRLASFFAGHGTGSFFLPEIGDEVIIGFINDDPRNAVVLGMLHSSQQPAPLEASNENPLKGIVTKSGIKMLFDDENRSYHLRTPAGKSVVLSEVPGLIEMKDEYGNAIRLSSSGIELISQSDVRITAQNNVITNAINIHQDARMNVAIKGMAAAELSSYGLTIVKGALVQIN